MHHGSVNACNCMHTIFPDLLHLFKTIQSPPSCMGGVIDGSSWNDKNFQSHRRSLDARFDSLWDAESPIQEFLLAAFEETGSEAYPERQQITDWVDTGSLKAASVFFSSPLLTGPKYILPGQ